MEKLKKQDCKPMQTVTEKVITFELLSSCKLSLNLLSLAICITKHITDFLHLAVLGFLHLQHSFPVPEKPSHTTTPYLNKNTEMFVMARLKAHPV